MPSYDGTDLGSAFNDPLPSSSSQLNGNLGNLNLDFAPVSAAPMSMEQGLQGTQPSLPQQNMASMVYNTTTPPAATYAQQQAYPSSYYRYQSPSLWDRMADKRSDVMRLVVISFVIVFALSVHGIITHYLNDYVSRSSVSDALEMAIRFSYPLIVLVLIWIMKSA